MTASDPQLRDRLREARRKLGWTQARLAQAIGTSQPAISQWEAGKSSLADATVAAIAEALGVDLTAPPEDAPSPARSTDAILWFCENPACPSNVPVAVGEDVWYAPAMVRSVSAHACTWCSGLLRASCSHCGEPVTEGIFCRNPLCGRALVAAPRVTGDPVAWADAQRAHIREIRDLTRPT